MPAAHDASEVAYVGKAVVDIIVGDVEMSLTAEFADGCEYGATVTVLIIAFHFAVGEFGVSHFVRGKIYWGVFFCCFVNEYLSYLGLSFAYNGRDIGFDDAGFFVGYFGECGPE